MRQPTGYTLVLACYLVALTILGASLCLGDERLAWVGLLLFTGLTMGSAFLITLNEH